MSRESWYTSSHEVRSSSPIASVAQKIRFKNELGTLMVKYLPLLRRQIGQCCIKTGFHKEEDIQVSGSGRGSWQLGIPIILRAASALDCIREWLQ